MIRHVRSVHRQYPLIMGVILIGLMGLSVSRPVQASTTHSGTVDKFQWAIVNSCFYFSMVGVPIADPVIPNSPYYAIPLAGTGFAQAYALLLSAKVAGSTVNVVSTGGWAGGTCGGAAVGVNEVDVL
jgi:hypothetical protein